MARIRAEMLDSKEQKCRLVCAHTSLYTSLYIITEGEENWKKEPHPDYLRLTKKSIIVLGIFDICIILQAEGQASLNVHNDSRQG